MAVARSQPSLGEYLVREGIISQSQLNAALAEQRKTSRSIGHLLVHMGLITESMRITVLQKQFNYEFVNLQDIEVDPMVLSLIPYSFAEKHRVVPVRQEGSRGLIVAMEDPSDLQVADAIKNQVGLPVRTVVATEEDIQRVLDQYQTGIEEQKMKLPRRNFRQTTLYHVLRLAAFPVVAFAPLVLFFIALWGNYFGVADRIRQWMNADLLTSFDLVLYFMLSWGLWTVIFFEINGLIFGHEESERE